MEAQYTKRTTSTLSNLLFHFKTAISSYRVNLLSSICLNCLNCCIYKHEKTRKFTRYKTSTRANTP